MTRWNLTVDDDTDRLVRSRTSPMPARLAAKCLTPRSPTSIGRAVRRAVFWDTVATSRVAATATADADEIDARGERRRGGRPVRLVADTNVLISGLISPRGNPAALLDAVAQGRAIARHVRRPARRSSCDVAARPRLQKFLKPGAAV